MGFLERNFAMLSIFTISIQIGAFEAISTRKLSINNNIENLIETGINRKDFPILDMESQWRTNGIKHFLAGTGISGN